KNFQTYIVDTLLKQGMISPEDVHLYLLTTDVDEAVDEMVNFYRVYHSMRYVHDHLIFRLFKRPSDELIAEINRDFSDILKDGEFKCTDALPEESDQPELEDLPRLVFHFNRRSHGRLRLLINRLNDKVE
ncbi:MAG: cytochrome D ubiquinol oxidase subunit II, partial [Planctomycetota bacterium]